ncbi:hypothetical protein PsAD2_03385 [Pseudovibrio axinellae]|uniref:DUF2062 domain-containing protein n=1 Tax=Pseudovibrio axinellae TaxID=989403 RepID=A0A161VBM4_9HYPH|nr:DUF2062 domain-containing protein [Pseudovibrio axinellae]KZL16768.1 hypothetical protein PsAD2_03385 [Pseudovibrio axinellae]SEQ75416.1 hypothetical protein SAMN05421798_104125 [Pseudovibrio axinellae]
MIFKRRDKPTRIERIRVTVWPRHSWSRSFKYFSKRVLRLSASPRKIAIGFAAGAAASFTPLIGFHFILSFFLAYVLRGNLLAAALGTAVGNPLTFPFIWASTYKLGLYILDREDRPLPDLSQKLDHSMLSQSLDTIWPILKPMLIGSVPLALASGIFFYFVVLASVSTYQKAREHRFRLKRKLSAKTRKSSNNK